MSTTPLTQLDLKIDIFSAPAQRAVVLANLRPPQLVAAIIAEFCGDENQPLLDTQADRYYLARGRDAPPLVDDLSLESQHVVDGEQLVLLEHEPPQPTGTDRPKRPIYLRHQPSARVYRLHWLPALVGRPAGQSADNDRLALNLAGFPRSDWVSRHHAQISEQDGAVLLTNLAENNPIVVRSPDGTDTRVRSRVPTPIRHKDAIVFIHSGIELQLLIADETHIQQQDTRHAS